MCVRACVCARSCTQQLSRVTYVTVTQSQLRNFPYRTERGIKIIPFAYLNTQEAFTCAHFYTHAPVSGETRSCPDAAHQAQMERCIMVTDSSVFVVS